MKNMMMNDKMTTLNIPNSLLVRLIRGCLVSKDIKDLFKYNPENFELGIICRYLNIKIKDEKKKEVCTKVNFPMEVVDVARMIRHRQYGFFNYEFTFNLTKELFFDIIKSVDSECKIKKNNDILMMFQDFIKYEQYDEIDVEGFVKCIGLSNFPDEARNYIKIMEF